MKKVIHAVMLMISLSIAVCSCDKEGGAGEQGKLEGKWWFPEKTDYFFNNTLVYSSKDFKYGLEKIKFENGSAMVYFKNDSPISTSYSFDGNMLVVGYLDPITISEISNKRVICEIHPYSESEVACDYDYVISSYKGKDIFYIFQYHIPYYYIGDNGKGVPCASINNGEYWYDYQISYFKAE